MSLPTQPADLPYPPGNSGLVRAAAADIRSTLEQLRTAKTAAVRLDDITSGAHWRGDAFDAFREAGDPFDAETARRFEVNILSAGGSREAADLYTAFRGRMPGPESLLKGRGLVA